MNDHLKLAWLGTDAALKHLAVIEDMLRADDRLGALERTGRVRAELGKVALALSDADATSVAPIEDAEPVAYEVRFTYDGTLMGFYLNSEGFEDDYYTVTPLYRHPAAPIEVTDEALRAAWFEWISHDERGAAEMRAALTAAFKEMS